MAVWAIVFIEAARRKARLGKERRKKVLEDGMSAIFSHFKTSPTISKALELCKLISKETGDLTVRSNHLSPKSILKHFTTSAKQIRFCHFHIFSKWKG